MINSKFKIRQSQPFEVSTLKVLSDRMVTTKCTSLPANIIDNNARKSHFQIARLLQPPLQSHHVLMARTPLLLCPYGRSFVIYGLGNDIHQRSRGALTTLIGYLPRVFYVYCDCMMTLRRFKHIITVTIKTGQVFGKLLLQKDDAFKTCYLRPWSRYTGFLVSIHLASSSLITR